MHNVVKPLHIYLIHALPDMYNPLCLYFKSSFNVKFKSFYPLLFYFPIYQQEDEFGSAGWLQSTCV